MWTKNGIFLRKNYLSFWNYAILEELISPEKVIEEEGLRWFAPSIYIESLYEGSILFPTFLLTIGSL